MANEADGATPLIIMIAMPTRGQVEVPEAWSIQRLTVHSRARDAQPSADAANR